MGKNIRLALSIWCSAYFGVTSYYNGEIGLAILFLALFLALCIEAIVTFIFKE